MSDYTYVDIFDIPAIMKVRTKTTVDTGLMEGGYFNFPSTPSEKEDKDRITCGNALIGERLRR